ncbi:Autophagy protein Atg27 [Aspergillus sclerotialis]|uniref:Autophagy-related protein 27 n=1 Tax=Aspergillus sclerotialis TaxID=2070753 RepID=A0A3A2ZMM9_9EURO|nr:Autophagy protein Atg27 [Aspergillus sclerotialis]
MRIQPTLSPLLCLLPTLVTATGFDCAHVNADGYKYDLSDLGGVHSLYHVDETEEYITNTTYVLNICNILRGASMRNGLKCGTSKNICGFKSTKAVDGSEENDVAFPIVGLDHMGYGTKDPEITRLKKLDSSREGLMVKLWGGEYITDKKEKKRAGAVIEFKCDPERSGLEGLQSQEETENPERRSFTALQKREDSGSDEGGDSSRSLQFTSFGPGDDNTYILKLDWRTKYSCDDYLSDNKGKSSGGHWGFFTWFIIILFLCVSAYLIFGSWLNYNRYGARGWDLLPHGDTIRDIPYILQDWFRRVVNTLQGTGSRGGYSAV